MRPIGRTALIELSESHLECLSSQILFLRETATDLHLVLNQRNRAAAARLFPSLPTHFLDEGEGFRDHWAMVTSLRHTLLESGINTAIFNTCEGNLVRDFSVIAPRSILYAGLLHHTEKLRDSFTQFLIGLTVKKYFVMNDHLLAHIPPRYRSRVRSMYPIFSPTVATAEVRKPDGEFWVCIPGVVEYRRRDYVGLVRVLRQTAPDPCIRFIVLGTGTGREGDEASFREMVTREGLDRCFTFFSSFIPQEVFDGYLRASDVILPLLHPSTPIYNSYRYHGISGTFNLAFAMAKPMLMDMSWNAVPDFQESALFYREEEIVGRINSLSHDREELREREERIRANPKFSFRQQKERYVGFLTGNAEK